MRIKRGNIERGRKAVLGMRETAHQGCCSHADILGSWHKVPRPKCHAG